LTHFAVATSAAKRRSICFLLVCFWIWGVLGLLIGTASILSLGSNVGVGTSAYITMGLLFWIGGMVLFGLGTILVGFNYDFQRPWSSATIPEKPLRDIKPFNFS
jgi:hypothetical protein